MKLARASEIVEAVGDVAILLHFEEDQPASDRMDSARGRIESVALLHLSPVEHAHDRSVERCGAQLFRRGRAVESHADARAGLRIEHDPRLVLSARMSGLPGRGIVRMHLHGQLFGCEKIFDEKRVVSPPILALKPDLAKTLVGCAAEVLGDVGPPPRLEDPSFAQAH